MEQKTNEEKALSLIQQKQALSSDLEKILRNGTDYEFIVHCRDKRSWTSMLTGVPLRLNLSQEKDILEPAIQVLKQGLIKKIGEIDRELKLYLK